MDDIVVIILTLLLTVVAAASQIKKKKEQQMSGATTPEPDFWQAVLGPDHTDAEKWPGEEVSDYPDTPYVQPAKPEQAVYKPEEEGSRNEVVIEYLSEIDHDQPETEGEEVYSALGDFSLRKAVVYTEVLNPKYF